MRKCGLRLLYLLEAIQLLLDLFLDLFGQLFGIQQSKVNVPIWLISAPYMPATNRPQRKLLTE